MPVPAGMRRKRSTLLLQEVTVLFEEVLLLLQEVAIPFEKVTIPLREVPILFEEDRGLLQEEPNRLQGELLLLKAVRSLSKVGYGENSAITSSTMVRDDRAFCNKSRTGMRLIDF
jgi:hypothetical protein